MPPRRAFIRVLVIVTSAAILQVSLSGCSVLGYSAGRSQTVSVDHDIEEPARFDGAVTTTQGSTYSGVVVLDSAQYGDTIVVLGEPRVIGVTDTTSIARTEVERITRVDQKQALYGFMAGLALDIAFWYWIITEVRPGLEALD